MANPKVKQNSSHFFSRLDEASGALGSQGNSFLQTPRQGRPAVPWHVGMPRRKIPWRTPSMFAGRPAHNPNAQGRNPRVAQQTAPCRARRALRGFLACRACPAPPDLAKAVSGCRACPPPRKSLSRWRCLRPPYYREDTSAPLMRRGISILPAEWQS